jgi:hypothetical protein
MTMLSDLTPRKGVGYTSYSGITLHRSCPQAWMYRQLYGLNRPPSDDAKVEMRFGTWWHALRAAEAIERGRRLGSIKFTPKTIKGADDGPQIVTADHEDLQGAVLEAAQRWEEAMSEDHAELWKKKLGGFPSALLRALDERYLAAHAESWNEQPIGVEVKWSRALPDSSVDLIGYTDEVYRDVKRGMVVVRDHKTSKQLGAMTAADDMLDSQLHLNAWGLKDRLEEWDCGSVQAISYERVNSVKPTTPKLTAGGKLSKQVTNFDLTTYMAFCESEEVKEKGYLPEPEQIERISSPGYQTKWFQRTLTPINRNIARAHLQAALDTEQDSRKTVDRVQRRREAPRNMTADACKWCDFAKLCRAQMVGGTDGEYQIEEYGLRTWHKKEAESPV